MTTPAPTSPKLRILAIGAHPDDCEFKVGGSVALWTRQGHDVCLMSMTNGASGHHELGAAQLIARRQREAAAAAAVGGATSRILPLPDGYLEPTLANRLLLIREIRRYKPDLILTNRPNDYHPDHRYTSQLVQDAAFSLTVPQIAPEEPALRDNPVIMYWWDSFQKPVPFAPDIAINIDAVWPLKLRMLHQHTSQFYQWLPWLMHQLDAIPADDAGRLHWLERVFMAGRDQPSILDVCRPQLAQRYSPQTAATIAHAEAFERCEYGSPLTDAARDRLFAGL